eukprot:TRINITY_DN8677_c0_g1_i1.p1 TRINITY_DN8677_c0_g1~~TRINITY_DN8677_c0_g1_i1.p1  ORF type:complete len:210 (+),score=69.57 TRINITY_DN8677_c0_g1_i1:23-652(+)
MEGEVSKLLQADRYSPEIIPQLEKYVQEQVDKKTYNLEANMALLKLYQFHTEKANVKIISQILIKALMNMPSTDFLLASYLISEKNHAEENITTLSNLHSLLERAQFQDFWKAAQEKQSVLAGVAGFDDAIRSFILDVVGRTYKNIARSLLRDMLNFKDETTLNTLLNAKDVKYTNDTVSFTIESQTKPKPTSENIRFEQLGKLLQALN